MPVYSSYPYLDVARLNGADYGLVLAYAHVLEMGLAGSHDANELRCLSAQELKAMQLFDNPGPTGSAIRYAYQQEQERRRLKYGFAKVNNA